MLVFIHKKMKKSIVRIPWLLLSLFLVFVVSSIIFLPSVKGVPPTYNIAPFIATTLSIQAGETNNGYGDNQDWRLHIGSGQRTYTTAVKFNSPFQEPPKVSVALSGQDIGGTKNNRILVIARDITVNGFNLVYITWEDSIVYGIWTSWTAIGLKA
jgi:hypothetical protein